MYNIIKVENLTAVIIEIVDGEKRGERKLALLFIFFFFFVFSSSFDLLTLMLRLIERIRFKSYIFP